MVLLADEPVQATGCGQPGGNARGQSHYQIGPWANCSAEHDTGHDASEDTESDRHGADERPPNRQANTLVGWQQRRPTAWPLAHEFPLRIEYVSTVMTSPGLVAARPPAGWTRFLRMGGPWDLRVGGR